jgi:tripeptide aminopeptidase
MDLSELLASPAVQRARARVVELEGEALAEQLSIVAVPAPTLDEGRRAEYLRRRLAELGIEQVHIDAVGNVIGRFPAPRDADASAVIFAAHLDTVFAAGTELIPRHVGNRIFAPGITDNARGLAVLLAVARALMQSRVATVRPLWFVCTVGEEGNGDLRGAKYLFRAEGPLSRPSAFIALDGSGIRRIVNRAIGARRLHITIDGPGGHSWSDWGTANPIHALGGAIARLQRIPLPTEPPLTLTVARTGGGTSVNAIPASAWLELDLRSECSATIATAEAECRKVVAISVDEANEIRRPGTAPLNLTVDVIGDRPSGCVAETAPLILSAVAATRVVGAQPELVASSTDSNVPMSLGIPAVTLGGGGESGGIHTAEEWFCGRDGARGLERALLTVLSAAGVA